MLQIMWMLKKISIHASAKEATSNETIAKEVLADFNPRLREGGDRLHLCNFCTRYMISIHASAKEATNFGAYYKKNDEDFNPRLREGGDVTTAITVAQITYFNPRLREGGDDYNMAATSGVSKFQSTPPRRRRLYCLFWFSVLANFNPRLREGGDEKIGATVAMPYHFNPRLREGGDRWHILCSQFLHLNFNPRLREGGDAMTVFAGI